MSVADARYVSFTSYRRNGDPVATAVWIAPLPDGRAGFTTSATAWKVKRLARDPRVALRPCNARGVVVDGAEEVTGTGEVVVDGADLDLVNAAMRRKYGLQFALVHLGGRLKTLVRRGGPGTYAVLITLD